MSLAQKFGEMCIAMYQDKSHQAKLTTMIPRAFGLVLLKVTQLVPTVHTAPRQKNSLTKDVTFLHKLYGE